MKKGAAFFSLFFLTGLVAVLDVGCPGQTAAAQTLPGASAQPQTGGASRAKGQDLPDLVIHQLGLTAAGSVIYQVANRGKASTQAPFVVDIYLNGVRKDTIRHEPLPGMNMQTVESNLARFPDCKGGTVRLVLDTLNTVRETDENNNERIAQLTPPCPKAP